MAPKPEPLSNVDAAWLSMDDPTNLMMITGVMTFKTPINLDHFLAVVEHRWLKFDRFVQRIEKPSLPIGKPHWEPDLHFDIAAHVHRIALPDPGDHSALQRLVSDLASTPLDPSKALWQVHIVENYGQGSALITRMHHSIADGLALVYVLLSLTDMTPDAPWPKEDGESKDEDRGDSWFGDFGDTAVSLYKQGASAAGTVYGLSKRAARESVRIAADPLRLLDRLQQGADYSYAASRLVLLSPDPPTPFKGKLGVIKRAAWSEAIPLRDVKTIKNMTHTTVNDVLVSALSGAIRSYLLEKGQPTEDFRAIIPVNMRTEKEMGTLGNKFGLVFLSLPVGIADPMKRLAEVSRRMAALKDSSEAAVALGILNIMGLSAAEIQSLILTIFATKATAVLTNVPGPPMPLFLAGSEIEDIMFWVPQAGRLGIGISILSYAGKVYLGIMTDAGLVPDPDSIITYFYNEFDLLKETLLAVEKPQFTSEKTRPPERVDDLTRVHGIDKEVQAYLNGKGIYTFSQLAAANGVQLQILFSEENGRFKDLTPANWPAQARYLASL
ncbi:MAG: wax ester/triacylglycerol synthase family O-acyltransferase [Candidatus Promineifilaceae bacterium]